MTTMHNRNQQPNEPLFYKSSSTTGMQPLGLAQGPYLPSYNDIHIILPISQAEAQTGTMRTLNFASGRQVTIAVPAHVSHGQVLRLEGQGELSPFGGPAGALVMTVTITPPGASATMPPIQRMGPAVPPPNVPHPETPTPMPPPQQGMGPPSLVPSPQHGGPPSSKRGSAISKGMILLLIGLVALIVVGSVGLLLSSEMIEFITYIMGCIFFFLLYAFPIWVAVHAWRKNFKIIPIAIFVTLPFIPLIPQLIALVAFFIVKPYHPNLNVAPKLLSGLGVGTQFKGASDRYPDGSFVTTEWFSVFYIPLVPIQSYRVIRGEHRTKWQGAIITESTLFSTLESLPLNIKHVLEAYGLYLTFFILLYTITHTIQSTSAIEVLIVATFIVGYIMFRWR